MCPETVLVADDNQDLADLLTTDILPHLGYSTQRAGDGQGALTSIAQQRPDLLLLDLQLPDMDGLAVLRQLAEQGISVPTILMSAHGSEQIVTEAFRLGVRDYLTKPLDINELSQSIERALRSSRLQKERDSLTTKLERQVRQGAVLTRVGQTVTSSLELDEVLRRIVEAAVYLTDAEEGFLLLYDEHFEEMFLRAEKNLGDLAVAIRRIRVDDSVLGQVVRTGKTLRTTQRTERERLKLKTGYLVRASLHVPLSARGKVLGVLSVDNALKTQEFSDADEASLVALADYAAIALDNARLYDETRRRAQQALIYAHELNAAHKSEQHQRQALDRLRSNFLNAIGHELKTPLATILLSLEVLQDTRHGPLNPEQQELAHAVGEQARHLQRMIDGLVAFAAFNAKQGQLTLIEAPIVTVLDEARDLAVFKAKAKEIAVKERRPSRLPSLSIDAPRLMEAVGHLLDNAIKFSAPKARSSSAPPWTRNGFSSVSSTKGQAFLNPNWRASSTASRR